MKKWLFVISMCIASMQPMAVHAASFAKQSLFLSQSEVYAGQTVFIYAVVTDDKTTPFLGELRFSDELGHIGTARVTLEPSRASTVSVSWRPTAGSHTVQAVLFSSDGIEIEGQEATFDVRSAPKVVPQQNQATPTTTTSPFILQATSTLVNSSAPLVDAVARVSPTIAKKSIPVFSSVDVFRKNSVKQLDAGTQWSKTNISKASAAPQGIKNTIWMILSTLALYACTVLAHAVANIGIFYPALLLIFFYILWRMFRLVRRR